MEASTAVIPDQFFDSSLGIDQGFISKKSVCNVVPESGAFSYFINDGKVFYSHAGVRQEDYFATKLPSIHPNEDVLLIRDMSFLKHFSDQDQSDFVEELLAIADDFATGGRVVDFWFYIGEDDEFVGLLEQFNLKPRELGEKMSSSLCFSLIRH